MHRRAEIAKIEEMADMTEMSENNVPAPAGGTEVNLLPKHAVESVGVGDTGRIKDEVRW